MPPKQITQIDCHFPDNDHANGRCHQPAFHEIVHKGIKGVDTRIVNPGIIRIFSQDTNKSILELLGWKRLAAILSYDELEEPNKINLT